MNLDLGGTIAGVVTFLAVTGWLVAIVLLVRWQMRWFRSVDRNVSRIADAIEEIAARRSA
jgi:hypothetical protein